MNRMEFPANGYEAQLHYLDGDYRVIRPGAYVSCAITGQMILLQDLKYWSVVRQEAYLDAESAYEAYLRHEKNKP